ncbi:MAG TPA: response regulator transcription factor [Caulobacteraceae bacterium]|nr:response regulator transcription factor [Caulobacteraceae bacterium]
MRILIVDDHAVVRHGLRRLLSPADEHVFAEAEEGRQALALAGEFRPHVIILDLNLPGLGGFELLRQLVEARCGRVLVLSMHAAPRFARRAMAAGAYGYVSKNAPPEELVTAVQRVNQGARYVDREIAQALALDPDDDPQNVDSLSIREMEILRLLAIGSSLEQIAVELDVSYKTIANNCAQMKSKLGVSRTVDLLRLAIDIHAGASAMPSER